MSSRPSLPVVLAGAHGHGRWHLHNIHRLHRAGVPVHLAGICDPLPWTPEDPGLARDVVFSPRLDEVLDRTRAAITIVSTPIHTHAELAVTAARAGSDILLEKPPTPTLADFDHLVDDLAGTGTTCQVGFQSLGSHALVAVRELMADGAIGEVRGIGAAGAWQRDAAYYSRARWAGRRTLDGLPVVDGALTNPFAHAAATAFALDGPAGEQGVAEVRVELFRANSIEADDTSCLRLVTARGTTITVAVTLVADEEVEPYLVVHGTRGRIVLHYRLGRVLMDRDGGSEVREYPATDLLENLADHVHDPGTPLLVPLAGTRAFMQVVEAVRLTADPVEISPEHRRVDTAGDVPRQVIPGSAAAVVRSADELALLSELGLPWAQPAAAARG